MKDTPMKSNSFSFLFWYVRRLYSFFLSLFLVAILSGGCPHIPNNDNDQDADNDNDDASPDSDAPASYPLTTSNDMLIGFNLHDVLYKFVWTVTPNPNLVSPDTTCPVFAELPQGWSAEGGEGGCVDDEGIRYEGRVVVTYENASANEVDWEMVYENFSVSDEQNNWNADAHGTVNTLYTNTGCGFPTPNLSTSEFDFAIGGAVIENFGGYFPGAEETVTVTFLNHHFEVSDSCTDQIRIQSNTEVEVADHGVLNILADYVESGAVSCREPISGQVTLEGDRIGTITFNGETECDDCLDWSIADGPSGEFCFAQP